MRIEILKQTSIAGSPVRVGQVIDASDSDAALLVATRKAKPVSQDLPPLADMLVGLGVAYKLKDEPAPEARPRPRKPRTSA